MGRLPKFVEDDADLIFAVGDAHGCEQALASMLKILLPLKQRCVFLGDYVDRGPDSVRVIDLLIAAKANRADWTMIQGNHELMLRESLELGIIPIGENTAFEQYATIGGVPTEHMMFLDDLLTFWESEQFIFVHGGVQGDPQIPIDERAAAELCWSEIVDPAWTGKTIVRGHVVVRDPQQEMNRIDLDTGCYRGGWLSAGILDDQTGRLLGAVQVSFDGSAKRFIQIG